jgi:hypothetical protein
MSADAVAVLVRRQYVIDADGDEAAVTDFHLAVKLEKTFGLAPIPRAVSTPAEHQDHGICPLKFRKFAVFARVIGQLIIGKYSASYNVCSHVA